MRTFTETGPADGTSAGGREGLLAVAGVEDDPAERLRAVNMPVLQEICLALETALPGVLVIIRIEGNGAGATVGGCDAGCRVAESLQAMETQGQVLPAGRQDALIVSDDAPQWAWIAALLPDESGHAVTCDEIADGAGNRLGGLYVFHRVDSASPSGCADIVSRFARLAAVVMGMSNALMDVRNEANRDGLTGLINRRRLMALLRDDLATDGRRDRVAVLLLDIDDFKTVNDSSGHGVGDSVLMVVADRLLAGVRPGDEVARLGGDEFVVLMREVDRAASEHVASRLLTNLREPLHVEGVTLRLTPSIGLALSVDFPDCPPERLLDEADGAMYLAKREGKDGMRTAGEHNARRRPDTRLLELMSDPRALDESLVLNAWPRWRDGVLVGRQLLLQWWDRDAERLRSMQGLLRQVQTPDARMEVQRICREAIRDRLDPAWFADGMAVAVRPPRPALLDPDYPEFLAGCLDDKSALPPQMELDVTEIMGDPPARIQASLHRLRDRLPGLRIAVRTIEQNALSLALLETTRPDVLRISVRDVLASERTGMDPAAALEAMCALARACHAEAIGDHVTTSHELRLLQAAGVRYWQGPCETAP
ncbi:sensor domain-containing diguanylate cyclase [Aquisalimonas asiatica]|uniref:sensor domain-containing diguanylate cyclase n=1 Tax=Aquisalimonas asiatica TaxID=406100 RepID=UPI001495A3AC|nr:sensor domain-containing diguanylate cyclase [Aquisalimonas asiatica]